MSGWRNSPTGFGRVSRVLHWLMALMILFMLALGTRLSYLQPGLANLWLYGLHKTVGFGVLSLVLVRLIWHRISPPPPPLGPPQAWENRLARAVHRAIYALILAIPLSGWVASSATGLDVMIFDRWVIPPIAPVSEAWDRWGFLAHRWLTRALMVLLLLHIAGAIRRGLQGDGSFSRMVIGR